LSDSQRDVLEAKGEFPQRVQLSERAVGWVEAEIDDWCAARIAARDDQQLEATPGNQ
jgi:predicted DNA-binding transcriptional regulator AlpA